MLHSLLYYVEHTIATILLMICLNIVITEGFIGLLRDLVKCIRKLPFVNSIIKIILKGEVTGAVKLLAGTSGADGGKDSKNIANGIISQQLAIPVKGKEYTGHSVSILELSMSDIDGIKVLLLKQEQTARS